jgi:hypothetical protein
LYPIGDFPKVNFWRIYRNYTLLIALKKSALGKSPMGTKEQFGSFWKFLIGSQLTLFESSRIEDDWNT